jgi:hypothetical protein
MPGGARWGYGSGQVGQVGIRQWPGWVRQVARWARWGRMSGGAGQVRPQVHGLPAESILGPGLGQAGGHYLGWYHNKMLFI